MRGGRKNLRFPADTALAERDRSRPLVSTSKTLSIISPRSSGALWRLILLYWAFKHAPLLRVPFALAGFFLSEYYQDCITMLEYIS